MPDALGIRDKAEGEKVRERRVIELAAEAGPDQQRLQLGAEDKVVAGDCVVERFLAGAVAGTEEPAPLCVPDRERKHAGQAVEALLAPMNIGRE